MSKERQETIEDIVADIRAQNLGLPEDSYALSPLVGDLLSLARRIEVANARERGVAYNYAQICGEIGEMIGREATSEKYSQVGNAAKMREALEKIASMGEQIDYQLGNSEETVYAFRHERCIAHNISECAREAISAPARNCDVGTTEEQHARFCSFCNKFDECNKCLLCSGSLLTSKCYSRWSQMPYEEGGAK